MSFASLFRKKERHPEKDVSTFVQKIQTVAQEHLKSILLFGSMASGEFHPAHSDANVMVIVEDLTAADSARLSDLFKGWAQKRHPLPIVIKRSELSAWARALPIEFLDIRDHHRVLYGEDVVRDLVVDTRNLQAQCEHDMTLMLLKIRQGIILAGANDSQLRELLIHSLPSVLTLYRATLRLKEATPGLSKIEASHRLAALAGLDSTKLAQLHEFRFSRKTDRLRELLDDYVMDLEKVLAFLNVIKG